MKKLLAILTGTLVMMACNPNSSEGGAVNDGVHAIDSNGALMDTSAGYADPKTDTATGEHRVDLQQRGHTDTTTGQ